MEEPKYCLSYQHNGAKSGLLWEVNQPFHHKQRGNVSSQFWRINSWTDLSTRFEYLVSSKVGEKPFREPGYVFTIFKSVEEEPRLVGRTVNLTCSLVCTIYETRLNLIEDKSRVAQLFVGISLKRWLSPLFHINHTAWLISTYVNQHPHTFNVYRFQYRGIPSMTIVLVV